MDEVNYVYQHGATNTSVGTTYDRPFSPFIQNGNFPAPGTYRITGVSLIFSEIRADSAMRHFYALINGVQCMNPQPTGLAAGDTGYNRAYGMHLDKDYTDFSTLTLTGNKGSASTDGAIFSVRAGSTITVNITYELVTSACIAPTAVSLSAALSEGNVNLDFSGAAGGVGNAIIGYEIQYAESADGINWSGWNGYTTIYTGSGNGSISVPSSGTRSYYRKYRMRALGSAGADWNSGWVETSNAVRRNSAPTALTTAAASPVLYESGNITISWGGAGDIDNNGSYYEVQYAVRADGGGYSGWIGLITTGAVSITNAPTLDRGAAIKYRSRLVDAFGIASDWKETNEVVRNKAPITPSILFPGSGKTTYNARPYVGLTIQTEPNAQTQTLHYDIDGGSVQNAGVVTAGTKRMQLPTLAVGSHSIRFLLIDSQGAESGKVGVTITVASNSYPHAIASGGLIVPSGISAKAEYLEMLNRTNTMRNYYGLTDIELPGILGYFVWWLPQMKAMQQGISDTCSVSGATAPAWLSPARNSPNAAVVNQIRSAIGNL